MFGGLDDGTGTAMSSCALRPGYGAVQTRKAASAAEGSVGRRRSIGRLAGRLAGWGCNVRRGGQQAVGRLGGGQQAVGGGPLPWAAGGGRQAVGGRRWAAGGGKRAARPCV